MRAAAPVPNDQAETVAIARPKPGLRKDEPPKAPVPRRVPPSGPNPAPAPPNRAMPIGQAGPAGPPRPQIPAPAGPNDLPPRAQPQHIPPAAPTAEPDKAARGGKVKVVLAAAGVLAVVLVVVLGAVFLTRTDPAETPEGKIRTSIDAFTKALSAGDLTALKAGTCGALGDYYQKVDPAVFADVHKNAQQSKHIPVLRTVDAVQITKEDQNAIAQATIVFDSDPGNVLTRTFDLANDGQGWKVCTAPR